MQSQTRATLFGLSAVFIWSTVASAFKIALDYMDPFQLLLVACAASTLTLGGVLAATGRLGEVRRMSGRDLSLAMLLGVLNPFVYYIVLFQAYALLPAQEAQPLNYTWAITLSLLSVPLLGQKLSLKDLLAILVSYCGVVAISTHGNPLAMQFTNPLGVGLALGSTIIWALYWIGNARMKADPVAGLFVNFLTGLPLVAAACMAFSTPPPLNAAALAAGCYVGVFEMGITFVLWLTALKLTTSSARIANLIFLSPFLSLVLIHFIVGEDILPSTIYGLVFIVAGNALMQWNPRR